MKNFRSVQRPRSQTIRASSKTSKEGEAWMVSALDPFHDFQLDIEGLPDERCAPSVVQVHNQVITMTAPTSAGSGSWDASVIYTGLNSPITPLAGHDMTQVSSSAVHTYDHAALSASGQQFGAFMLWAGAAGTAITTGGPVTSGDLNVSLGTVLPTDRCRLIGLAFEIHNTTAEIYKQGSLTVAQLPDCAADQASICYLDVNSSSKAAPVTMQGDRCCLIANTAPYLQAVPGSSTWPAAEGVYAIPRMTTVPRDIASFNTPAGTGGAFGSVSRVPILYGSDGKTATLEPCGRIADATITSAYVPIFTPMAPSGFSPMQIFLSGLSSPTALTINVRSIVEYFPAVGSTLLPLATPSPVYDPKAFALYAAVCAKAPYAVMVCENGLGDYFRKILEILGNAAVLVSPIFGPYAPISTAVGGLAKTIAGYIPKDEAGPRSNIAKRRN